MFKDVTSLLKPESVAVIGASAKRVSQGNLVIANLLTADFPGPIIPIHPTANTIDGLQVISSPDDLPGDIDLAVLAIPASSVTAALKELQRNDVRAAIVFANGFSATEEKDLRRFVKTSRMVVHGPNCMGLINVNDDISLYPTRPSEKVHAGGVALLAQSGSAAISIMNSANAGFSKVVTMGSEFQITVADYIHWLATDNETTTIGVVTEEITDPLAFAEATALAHSAGKMVVVLKVGTSEIGAAAAQAHTGALISNQDAYKRFFLECDIATARDFDELVASLECLAHQRKLSPAARGIAVIGISGGQTALACDLAEQRSVPLATFSENTRETVKHCLPGSIGNNPIDIGATLALDRMRLPDALDAVMNDDSVAGIAFVQDAQDSLNPRSLASYESILDTYANAANATAKPVALISPTGQNLHKAVVDQFSARGVPVLRGLSAGIGAIGNMAKGDPKIAHEWVRKQKAHRKKTANKFSIENWRFNTDSGVLDRHSSAALLQEYGIPHVNSIVVQTTQEAIARANEIGFPMVAKVVSTDVPHRSEAGGVIVGIENSQALSEAIERITANVTDNLSQAVIQGFELQQDISNWLEVMVGFTQASPFGSLIVVGTGGTTAELEADRALRLSPVSVEDAEEMLIDTKVGKLLSGYRRLHPDTDLRPLAKLVSGLSMLANDYRDALAACDLNPVMVQPESGRLCTVDTLIVVDCETLQPKQDNNTNELHSSTDTGRGEK